MKSACGAAPIPINCRKEFRRYAESRQVTALLANHFVARWQNGIKMREPFHRQPTSPSARHPLAMACERLENSAMGSF